MKKNIKEYTDIEIIDTLGIETEYISHSILNDILKQARKLIAKGHDLNNVWLIGDYLIYTKGKIIDKTKDLIAVEEK